MTYLEEYHELIRTKQVIAGYWLKQEIQNLVDDLQDERFIYDTAEAHKRIKFMETLCLQSKAPYYMKPIKLMPWQKAWWEAVYSFRMSDTGLRRFTDGILEIARKNGKALALDTRIPTPFGDKTIEDINVGDFVYGVEGNPVSVIAVSPIFTDHRCYEVEFEDGEIIVSDAEHLWFVEEKLSRGKQKLNKTTAEIEKDYFKKRNDGKGYEYKYRVPLPKAEQRENIELPINPYILGVWLGDGMSRSPRISCGKEDLEEMVANLQKCGADAKVTEYKNNNIIINLANNGQGKRNEYATALRLLGVKNNKHIPRIYFESSEAQRWELLCGLMDTDGTCSKSGQCEFVQKSEKLTNDLSRLLSSLGIKHSVKNKIASCNGKRIPVYRILFYVDAKHSCFHLERKTKRLKSQLANRMNAKSIVRVTECKSVPTKCLCVDGGLYLCGERNTVTHNSTMFSADAMFDLFCGAGGADIITASNDDRQCRIIWDEIAGMRTRLDPKKLITSQNLTKIRNIKKDISVCRVSARSKSLDGFNVSKVYMDESHDISEENGQSKVAEALWRGMSSKDEPIFLNCTTQGFNRDCYLDHRLQYAKKVISGEIEDPHLIAFLFEQDSENEIWQDSTTWEKSNPSLRYGVKKIEKLQRDVEMAKHDQATRIHLLTKDFNIPQSSAQSWLLLEDYDYPIETFDLEDFRGSIILGAVDLSATTDLSNAKALLMKPNDKHKYILSHYFIPESKLEDSNDKEAGAKYVEWAKQGLMTIHEGNEIDITDVADWFFRLFKNYGLKPYKIGYDQRYAKNFLDRCDEYGFETEMLLQGRALSNAMKLTEADLKSKVINYNQHAVDKWCFANCCCQVDNYGNIQPVKARGQKSKRIDGAVTAIMLEETYRRYKNEFLQMIGSV